MKRYLFLKLCLSILCYSSSVATRLQVTNGEIIPDESIRIARADVQAEVVPEDSPDEDDKAVLKNYQEVMGRPGVDFPVLTYIPRTTFTCKGMRAGYYADLETRCQVFHICDEGRKVSFLCPNGTIFQQSDLICDWWFKVDCQSAPSLYEESAEQLEQENIRRKEARRVQESKRLEEMRARLSLIESKATENLNLKAQGREIPSREDLSYNQRRSGRVREQTRNDLKNFVSIFAIENENKDRKADLKAFKETQVPAETASFVNRKYNEQQPYFKSINEVNKVNYLPQNHKETVKPESSTRSSRNFETTTTKPYRGRNNDYLKTTTQHTIYSPTVPPYTASKVTKVPPTRPIQTTTEAFFRPRITTTLAPVIKPKPIVGFFITKSPSATRQPEKYTQNADINIFDKAEKEPLTPAPFTKITTTTPPPSTTQSIQTTTTNNRQLNSRGLEKSFSTYDFSKFNGKALYTSPQVTTNASPVPNQKSAEKGTTNRFNQYTYLPKTDDNTSPKPTNPTPYQSYTTPQSVTDNLSNMIKTLQTLDPEDSSINIENLISRPGLNIPPSAGPNTLHSLAVYFATALDNLVSNETNTNFNSPETSPDITTTELPQQQTTITDEDRLVTLLSRHTVDKYNSLFMENRTEQEDGPNGEANRGEKELDIKALVEHDAKYHNNHNDLDVQQSQGPLSSTPRIRQLAQVFTQALSAYLDDPETFRRVLEEIRPTEPPEGNYDYFNGDAQNVQTSTEPSEYASYTKEDDEVLDFSDSDKTSTYPAVSSTTPSTSTTSTTTERVILNEISTSYPNDDIYSQSSTYRSGRAKNINSLAVALNNNLGFSSQKEDSTSESNYFPSNHQEDDEYDKKRLTAKPYGFGVRPSSTTTSSTTTTTEEQPPGTTADTWSILNQNYNQINTNLSEFQPFDALLPPYDVSQLVLELNRTSNEEYLQSAHSQSFVSHGKNLITDNRKGKAVTFDSTTTEIPTTELYNRFQTNEAFTTTTEVYSTTELETTVPTTEYSTTEETGFDGENTTESSTPSTIIPQNHWSTSPVVTKLWETTLYVNPLIINHNLEGNNHNQNQNLKRENDTSASSEVESGTTTTELYDLSTQESYGSTTTTEEIRTTTDVEFEVESSTSTTEGFSTTQQENLLTGFQVPAIGINNLLNSSELEIASSQANQLFGNLDLSEQDLLMEKMKMAESNSTVRRLILLLVSTCDASLNHNKTVQETRNYILHALLGVPLNKSLEDEFNSEDSSSTVVPQSNTDLKSRSGKAIKTDLPISRSTSTSTSSSTSTVVPELETTTLDVVTVSSRAYVLKKAPSKAQVPNYNSNHNHVPVDRHVHQNTRALELLRSLYSLAAKWSKKK